MKKYINLNPYPVMLSYEGNSAKSVQPFAWKGTKREKEGMTFVLEGDLDEKVKTGMLHVFTDDLQKKEADKEKAVKKVADEKKKAFDKQEAAAKKVTQPKSKAPSKPKEPKEPEVSKEVEKEAVEEKPKARRVLG